MPAHCLRTASPPSKTDSSSRFRDDVEVEEVWRGGRAAFLDLMGPPQVLVVRCAVRRFREFLQGEVHVMTIGSSSSD